MFGNCVGGGVNLFDTAEVYGFGRSEYLCGKFRRDYKGPEKNGIVLGEMDSSSHHGSSQTETEVFGLLVHLVYHIVGRKERIAEKRQDKTIES